MTEEKPLISEKSLIDLAEEILDRKVGDKKTAKRFFASLQVLRVINGHPAVFRSEVFAAMKSDSTKK